MVKKIFISLLIFLALGMVLLGFFVLTINKTPTKNIKPDAAASSIRAMEAMPAVPVDK